MSISTIALIVFFAVYALVGFGVAIPSASIVLAVAAAGAAVALLVGK